MCSKYLGFVLLVWFPGVLHAQSAEQKCNAPNLDRGYFVPEEKMYSDGATLMYACNNGHKPAVEGWWGTSTCENGKWSPAPQCIDENACIPPEIPNAQYTATQNGWYEDGHRIRITCDRGYEPKARAVTATCINGAWSSVPVCEKSIQACGEPPKIPHAVIIQQRYQEVFPVDSELQYECEAGYTVEGADSRKNIFCIAGNWTEGPTCSRETGPGAGQGGSVGTETVCRLEPVQYDTYDFKLSKVEDLGDGEIKHFPCIWSTHIRIFNCTNGRITSTTCCHFQDYQRNLCRSMAAE